MARHAPHRALAPSEFEDRLPDGTGCMIQLTHVDGQGNVWRLDPEQNCYHLVQPTRWDDGPYFEQALSSALCGGEWNRELAACGRAKIWTVRDFAEAYSGGRIGTVNLCREGRRQMYLSAKRIQDMYDAVRRARGEWVTWRKNR